LYRTIWAAPRKAYDDKGELVWQVDFDIYGRIREDTLNNKPFIPFRQPGQYEDVETGLYYNRFRYYDSNTGTYISQDPIRLAGNNPNFYAYTFDSNSEVDPFGLVKQGIHGFAPDYETKGLHGTFDEIELSIKPGQNGNIVYKNVFSKDVDISKAVSSADQYFSNTKNLEKALHNLEGAKDYYDKLGKGREWREMKRNLENMLKNECH
jgi:RHS repeat-associated protein